MVGAARVGREGHAGVGEPGAEEIGCTYGVAEWVVDPANDLTPMDVMGIACHRLTTHPLSPLFTGRGLG